MPCPILSAYTPEQLLYDYIQTVSSSIIIGRSSFSNCSFFSNLFSLIHIPPLAGRDYLPRRYGFATIFSTHTSHKGCNSFIFTYSSFLHNFNPYTPCGVQLNKAWRFHITLLFQSMHPRGVQQKPVGERSGSSGNFNPCTLAGCNILASGRSTKLFISIHAPSRGATKFSVGKTMGYHISIHAPSRGATVKANRINASDLQNIKQFLQLTHPQLSHTTGLLALLCILSLYPRCEPPLETTYVSGSHLDQASQYNRQVQPEKRGLPCGCRKCF